MWEDGSYCFSSMSLENRVPGKAIHICCMYVCIPLLVSGVLCGAHSEVQEGEGKKGRLQRLLMQMAMIV